MGDLTNRGWIITMGLCFAVLVVMAGAGVCLYEAWWQRLGFYVVGMWAAARFYYFCFYVLERYVGVEGRYAGLLDLLQRLWRPTP
jgi:hypothetical protein